jgi:hypothetical protein
VSVAAVIIIGPIILTKKNPSLIICGSFSLFIGIIGAILLLTGWLSGYEWRKDEVITYEITIDETTPYLALQKYHLIKEENGIYTFETPLID